MTFLGSGFAESRAGQAQLERHARRVRNYERETIGITKLAQPIWLPGFWFVHNGLDNTWYRMKNSGLVVTWKIKR